MFLKGVPLAIATVTHCSLRWKRFPPERNRLSRSSPSLTVLIRDDTVMLEEPGGLGGCSPHSGGGRLAAGGCRLKAIVIRGFGDPEVLRWEEVPTHTAGPQEVLVRVHAVSVNRTLDLQVGQDGGGYGAVLPLVLGNDPSGMVVAVGQGVEQPAVNQRVAVLGPSEGKTWSGRCSWGYLASSASSSTRLCPSAKPRRPTTTWRRTSP